METKPWGSCDKLKPHLGKRIRVTGRFLRFSSIVLHQREVFTAQLTAVESDGEEIASSLWVQWAEEIRAASPQPDDRLEFTAVVYRHEKLISGGGLKEQFALRDPEDVVVRGRPPALRTDDAEEEAEPPPPYLEEPEPPPPPAPTPTPALDPVSAIRAVRALARDLGGMDRLKELVEALS